MRKYEMILAGILTVMIMGFLTGCTGSLFKNMGSFEPSTTATQNFEKFVINDDYNYYLTGSDVYPVAIFGLKKAYIIDSDEDLWKKIDPKQEVMSELVTNMQLRALSCCLQGMHGHDILDNHGRKIGEWYSLLSLIIGIKIKEDGKVVIYPPTDNNDVKRYQGRDYPTMF
ncbi:MAG: hypothetical protein CVU71_15365 [Deltaproteobacteria bacterium HGW-Deltaproteobacteria-6]|nr:MAG: hypothetical protein CVU71_15365 [Deltaproteobacteria bacterium HGW-Deltaproteobacteria-6]